jgi:septin family protein
VKGDLWSNDTSTTSSTDIVTINVEHVGQKEDLYVNDTNECGNMYSNTELSEKISKYRIAVNDLALVVEMKKKNTDFKEEFSVRIVYYYLPLQ